jgi:hypothetical protein
MTHQNILGAQCEPGARVLCQPHTKKRPHAASREVRRGASNAPLPQGWRRSARPCQDRDRLRGHKPVCRSFVRGGRSLRRVRQQLLACAPRARCQGQCASRRRPARAARTSVTGTRGRRRPSGLARRHDQPRKGLHHQHEDEDETHEHRHFKVRSQVKDGRLVVFPPAGIISTGNCEKPNAPYVECEGIGSAGFQRATFVFRRRRTAALVIQPRQDEVDRVFPACDSGRRLGVLPGLRGRPPGHCPSAIGSPREPPQDRR